jgi:hypothetical protein
MRFHTPQSASLVTRPIDKSNLSALRKSDSSFFTAHSLGLLPIARIHLKLFYPFLETLRLCLSDSLNFDRYSGGTAFGRQMMDEPSS